MILQQTSHGCTPRHSFDIETSTPLKAPMFIIHKGDSQTIREFNAKLKQNPRSAPVLCTYRDRPFNKNVFRYQTKLFWSGKLINRSNDHSLDIIPVMKKPTGGEYADVCWLQDT